MTEHLNPIDSGDAGGPVQGQPEPESTPPADKTAESMDTELGRVVVESGLATQEDVHECLAKQEQEEGDPSQRSLAAVLVREGMVTDRQIERIKKSIEATRGQQIPGYQLLKKLGAGAMATVFMAKQISLDRTVAIKVLPRKLSENAEYVKMFYKEGKAAAKLNHPNIVQAIDVGESGGYHYFVMEYVEGHTLFDELAQGKVFTEAEALKVIILVAQALEHAHGQDLIHRDVKPKNIMITPSGLVKLADMGLARSAADVEAAKAEAGRAFGTPYYISPEQIRGELDIDFRADIYSLGATMYHLVTGRVPFEGPTPAAVMHKHLKNTLKPPDHLNTSLSAGVGEVVEVMMAKDRRRRYASTTDLLMDLEAIAAGEPPLQARKQIDGNVLTGLAGEGEAPPEEEEGLVEAPADSGNWMMYVIILAAALALSVIVNIALLVM
jgi:eukaryotic-like serine/threonine-protein kinase